MELVQPLAFDLQLVARRVSLSFSLHTERAPLVFFFCSRRALRA